MNRHKDYSDSTLVATYLARVDWPRVHRVDTRRYGADYMTAGDANRMPWPGFVTRLPTLDDHVELRDMQLVTSAKSVTWSDRDINVYVGSAHRQIRSYQDLDLDDFTAVFGWHLALARRLSAMLDRDVYVTHGFNPDDTSPDAHSVNSKFHTHIHVPQTQGRVVAAREALTHFHHLGLIEPYAGVFRDRAAAFLTTSQVTHLWQTRSDFGFFSLTALFPQAGDDQSLTVLHHMLADLNHHYQQVVDVLTARQEETLTRYARYVPRPRAAREAAMDSFIRTHSDWLSEESCSLLRYLARSLRPATARDSPQSASYTSAGQAWLAKGLSGAFNFVVNPAGAVRFDFAPRVISTSGCAKVIAPEPTVVIKDQGLASPAEHARMIDFHEAMRTAQRMTSFRLSSLQPRRSVEECADRT